MENPSGEDKNATIHGLTLFRLNNWRMPISRSNPVEPWAKRLLLCNYGGMPSPASTARTERTAHRFASVPSSVGRTPDVLDYGTDSSPFALQPQN
jgi:hypothetical protein